MQEAGDVDLEEYVGEGKDEEYCDSCDKVISKCSCNDDVEESSDPSAKFESWANAVVEGTMTDDEIANLKDLLDSGLTLGVDGVSAVEALQGIGIDDADLFAALEHLAKVNSEADPSDTITAWVSKNDPEAAEQLGLNTAAPAAPEAPVAPEAPAEEGVGDDYADKSKKLAQAGQKPKEPNLSVGQKLKSIVKGAQAWVNNKPDSDSDLDLDEVGEEGEEMPQQEVTLHDIAEMVKSFYDKETKKFPLGKTGVVTKVRKEMGDNAATLAERLVDHLEANGGDDQHHNDMAVEPNDSISPVHGHDERDPEQEAFEDILRLSGLSK